MSREVPIRRLTISGRFHMLLGHCRNATMIYASYRNAALGPRALNRSRRAIRNSDFKLPLLPPRLLLPGSSNGSTWVPWIRAPFLVVPHIYVTSFVRVAYGVRTS